MGPAEAINLTSTSNNPERRLFELYQQYRLISIEVSFWGENFLMV
jgi:hypothetical protein